MDHAKGLPLPKYATEGSSGMDLIAACEEEGVWLNQGEVNLIPTGLKVEIPLGWEIQVRARSGFGKKGIILPNGVGTIDSDYRGEIFVMLLNLSTKPFQIQRGMRIGQIILGKYGYISWQAADKLSESSRGAGGFGSTGMK